ncbi:hypothetical protein [Pseudaestuariivita atlantica]|uniref:PIN like domain-containing protein n=1 Tax=Pseudaestuariivita atlantica TaxID=1317121 RepID=A0A0L1JRZ2_9RHOB|nr:hypothetical protein [Pseudaestuariivita atlantica]KNG94564.1 hypothetical protein ATO11_03910 [Pseudaestuariivita atlantica]
MTKGRRFGLIREEQFHQLFRRSAFLAREFFGQIESHRFSNEKVGRKIIYVYDTSILTALTAPWSVGPLQGRSRHGLGQLLPRMYQIATEYGLDAEDRKVLRVQRAAEDRLAIRITELLANAAVEGANAAWKDGGRNSSPPLWQMRAHFEETNRLRDAIRHRVDSLKGTQRLQNEADRRNHMKKFVELALKSWAKNGERHSLPDFLDYVVDEIMTREVLSGFGVARQSASLNAFDRKCFKLEDLADYNVAGLETLFGMEYSPMEREAHAFLERYWQERLQRKVRASSTETWRIQRDAEALAELAIVNRRILDHGFDLRVVLVTGDRNLVEASYNGSDKIETSLDDIVGRFYGGGDYSEFRRRTELLNEFFLNVADGQDERKNWFDRFSLHYVRHLHAFAHDEIAEGVQTAKVFSFLSGLFVDTAGPILQKRRLLEDISLGRKTEKPPRNFREEFLDVIENWDRLALRKVKQSRFSSWHSLDETSQAHLVQIISDDLKRLSGGETSEPLDFEAAAIWMMEYVDRTRDRTMLHFSNLGTEMLQGTGGGWIVRNPPDLQFSNLKNTKAIFDKLASRYGYAGAKQDAFHKDFEAISDDVPEDQREDGRLECHLQFLALGAAFAAADKWSVAESHAHRALAILDRAKAHDVIPSIPPIRNDKGELVCNFSGREAHFLSAVCKRIRAENDADLDEAEIELKKALEAFDEDRDASEPFMETGLLALRHLAERMSISLSRYYIARANCDADECVNDTEEKHCADCAKARDALFDAAEELYSDQAVEQLTTAGPSLSALSLATNAVQLSVIRAYWIRETDGDVGEAGKWMSDAALLAALGMLDRIRAERKFIFNETSRAYEALGRYIAHARGLEVAEPPTAEGVIAVIADLNNHMIATYDPWRFRRIRKFLQGERKLVETT